MKIVLLGIGLLTGLFIFSCQQSANKKSNTREEAISDTVLVQVEELAQFLDSSFIPTASAEDNVKKLQQDFLKARLLYKKFEWAATYFMGNMALKVNGPPVPEVEDADVLEPQFIHTLPPSGLQVIEETLFPKFDTTQKAQLLKQLKTLREDVGYLKYYFKKKDLEDWRILDAAKLEVFRVLTLGISGYDNPLTLKSMKETAVSLKSLQSVLAFYTTKGDTLHLNSLLTQAIAYLHHHQDFNSFNRAFFITKYGNKISSAITDLQYKNKGFDVKYNRLLKQTARTLFDSGAYNVNAFAPGKKAFLTKEKAKLGKRLFFDASLSGTGTRSCSSCHQPDKAFTDGFRKHPNIHNGKPIKRNTPTLINVALQSNQFYDMRALTLEDQAHDVIENPNEMDGSLKAIVQYLSEDSTYKTLFAKAFPEREKNKIDSFEVLNALASFGRSMTKLNSRFDQYMRGDSTALTKQQIHGFNLFMGKAKCGTCHFMPLFNGLTPPKFVVSEAEVIGVPVSKTDTTLDPDLGWYDIIGKSAFRHAFKTPTLRNVSKTAPYMHNGIYDDLEEVMEFYNNAGGVGMGLKIENSTLPEDSLHLTDQEEDDIIAFMKSLDSR